MLIIDEERRSKEEEILCTYKYAYVVCFVLGKLDPEEWCCSHEKIFEAQLLVFKLFLNTYTISFVIQVYHVWNEYLRICVRLRKCINVYEENRVSCVCLI